MPVSPNIYNLFMMETSDFLLVTLGGVQSAIILNRKACDWHGCAVLHSSKVTHHKEESDCKSHGDFKCGT